MYTTTMRGCGTGSTRSRSTSHTSYYTHPVLTQPLTQQRTLHPATYPSSYAHFSAYQPTYDTSVMMYPSYPTYPSTTYSTFPLSQPLPISQHISQPLQQQQLALLMQHAWMQQASCFQQSQHQQQTSLYPSVCFPSTTYYPPTSLPVLQQAPAPASAPIATSVRPTVLPTVHAHMHTHTQDPSWILAHPSPSESIPSSTSSSRTCSPTYHLPCTCTGCHGTCTCSHPHAPQSCTSQASIGTSVDSIPHPRSYSPPQLMLPPIMIPPSSSEVHSATIHRTRNDSETEDTTAALASTHISDIPPLSLTTSTSTSSLSSYGSGSIRNNFETPLMIIDDDEHESPKHGRMRAMTVMGMMMAASQRSVTTPHSTRPRRLSQRMSILRPMAMSQPVSPQPTTRDVEAEISHDNATSTIKPSSFEPTTSLSMSLSPLHPMEWPGDDKYEYTCDDEYDKLSYDFASQQRISYHKPTFSYADVVRSKQSMQKRTTTRVPHVVSRA